MTREDDIKAVCKAVIETNTTFFDNPNGPYENSCPFCSAKKYSGGEKPYYDMDELKHDLDCAYVIAKDLMTNLK